MQTTGCSRRRIRQNQRHRKLVVEAATKFWDKAAKTTRTALKGQFGNKVKEAFQRQTISLKQSL